jgi:hypothetical protein
VSGVLVMSLVPACGEKTTEPVIEGAFTGTITGDIVATANGRAAFGVTDLNGASSFFIVMVRGSVVEFDLDIIPLFRFSTERPPVGSYVIVAADPPCATCGPSDFDAAYFWQRAAGAPRIFGSESGSLTITRSTADTVAGSATIAASEIGQTGAQVNIQVTFTAVPGSLPRVPGG